MIPTLEDIILGLLAGTMTHEDARKWLQAHLDQQADLGSLSVPSYERSQCVIDVIKKCEEQDRLWGEGRVYPSFNLTVTSNADNGQYAVAGYHEVVNAARARTLSDGQAESGELSWMTILVEEVAKLTEKYEQPLKLREQLIDVAGVAVQWAAQLTPVPQLEHAKDSGDGQ